jgi:hypothetical protein
VRLTKPNIAEDLLRSHDFATNVKDNFGRNRRIVAWPKNSGVVCYFDSLRDLRKWERDVLDVRAAARGELSLAEKCAMVFA